MEEKFEVLEQVHHDACMAAYTIEKLMEKLKDKDNKIKAYIEEILKEYQEFEEESRKILEENNKQVSTPSMMAKMGSTMGITKEVNKDNSDSSMADMLIQGISMGSLEIEKKLKQYEEELDKEHKSIAKKFLKFQEKTIDHLKKYL